MRNRLCLLTVLCIGLLGQVGCSKKLGQIVVVRDESRPFSRFDGSTTVQFDDGSVRQYEGILGTNGMWVRVR